MTPNSESVFVLYAEDDDGDAFLLERTLAQSDRNIRIGRVSNGREALSMLKGISQGKHDSPQLIILDWKLPIISGLDVLEFVRKSPATARIPVVIFTSSNAGRDELTARQAGCTDFLVKPIDYLDFKEVIHQICETHLEAPGSRPDCESYRVGQAMLL